MRILIAPDSFKESLTANEVAHLIAQSLQQEIPDARLDLLPMADGGEGTVDAIVAALGGEHVYCEITGPLGVKRQAKYGLIDKGATAVIEMAEACGLILVDKGDRDPLKTTSFGYGELVIDAIERGVNQIVMGIGGSATNDGGLAMCQALGARFYDSEGAELQVPLTGGKLLAVNSVDFSALDSRLSEVSIAVACDVDNPLLGPLGATEVFGRQKGATEEAVVALERGLDRAYQIIEKDLGREIRDMPGAGAAGGMGAALVAVLNANLRPGVQLVAELVQLAKRIQENDLVITGEGSLDGQSAHGKTPVGVAKLAKKYDVPVIAIGGMLDDRAPLLFEHDIDAIEGSVAKPCTSAAALLNAKSNLS
ncbi:MAG: glycerate kinase, partial [Gammaproteobacteria bacterium]